MLFNIKLFSQYQQIPPFPLGRRKRLQGCFVFPGPIQNPEIKLKFKFLFALMRKFNCFLRCEKHCLWYLPESFFTCLFEYSQLDLTLFKDITFKINSNFTGVIMLSFHLCDHYSTPWLLRFAVTTSLRMRAYLNKNNVLHFKSHFS